MPKGLSYPSGPAGTFQDAPSLGSFRPTARSTPRSVSLADVATVEGGRERRLGLGTITIIVLVSLAIFVATVNLGTKG